MSANKAFYYAIGITLVSAICLTVANGIPTVQEAFGGGVAMFIIAFVVMKRVPKVQRPEDDATGHKV